MNPKLKIIIPAIIVVVTLVVLALVYKNVLTDISTVDTSTPKISKEAKPSSEKAATAEEQLPPATGNIDDTVNAFLEESADEQAQVAEDEEETSQINSELQEIDELNQAGSSDNL